MKNRIDIIILILIVCILGLLLTNYVVKVRKLNEERINQEKTIIDQNEEIKNFIHKNYELKQKLNQANEELNSLKEDISGIKDKDDLLKRDIKLYIKRKHPKVSNVVASSIAENIIIISKKYKVSPELILGIIRVESAFDPMAVGPKTKYGHARGLMQVMPDWGKKFKLKSKYDMHNINTGIECGVKVFLIHLTQAKGDISGALFLYVNQDKSYVGKVYAAMGKFVAFRSTITEVHKEANKKEKNK
jgi:hypothetical protein